MPLLRLVPREPASRPLDPRIRRALDALEARIAERWTVAKLARVAGMSRAAFARTFVGELGQPPLRWLTARRIAKVATELLETKRSLAEIAVTVGYVSEFALSRAFRRVVGLPPRAYRRLAAERAPTMLLAA